ncbi:MAG: MarR family transcriptional regulator, partial [Deltaproteobacteria bacterium]|nr:MarR family transcriptional regulator [Deltaproteobacteria bacterium]
MTEPTKRQSEYLDFIRAFTDRWKIPPSFEEIGTHFGTTPPSVNNMVKTLEARGFLTRVPGAARTLRVLVEPGRAAKPEGSSAAVADAVRLATLVVERLVPALKGAEDDYLHRAFDAVS